LVGHLLVPAVLFRTFNHPDLVVLQHLPSRTFLFTNLIGLL
jgi:hypothetical protein